MVDNSLDYHELFPIVSQPYENAFNADYLAPLVPTGIFRTYWQFAAERQRIYWKRFQGAQPPWTEDPILQVFKFTNCYRVLDRVSQYLVRNIATAPSLDESDAFLRTILFKIFNKVETWELLEREFGRVSADSFSPEQYGKVLSKAFDRGTRLYSAAYIMPSGNGFSTEPRKHLMHLSLLRTMIRDGLPARVSAASSMEQVFQMLKSYPTIGDFLAFQYAIDLNYGSLTNFTEMDFVVAGPGAQRGIRKCFSYTAGLSDAEVIRKVTETQRESFSRLGLDFQNLWGRDLQLIDCQNLFCEIDKYTRVSNPELHRGLKAPRIKQKFRASGELAQLVLPSKWKLVQP